jgi:hypothetical protein
MKEEVTMKRFAFFFGGILLYAMFAMFAMTSGVAHAQSAINPKETFVLQRKDIHFVPWDKLPPGSGEMAKLYGDFDKPGPYLVLMKWHPGWFSAPHSYATDRIQVVVSGTWWVNSGRDFRPGQAVPVPAGGYVERVARTFHYDGVPRNAAEPAVIAVFGIGPVNMVLADPKQPSWRRVGNLGQERAEIGANREQPSSNRLRNRLWNRP